MMGGRGWDPALSWHTNVPNLLDFLNRMFLIGFSLAHLGSLLLTCGGTKYDSNPQNPPAKPAC
jgi:hypothetical protein